MSRVPLTGLAVWEILSGTLSFVACDRRAADQMFVRVGGKIPFQGFGG